MAAPDDIGFHAYDSAAWRRIDNPEYRGASVWHPIKKVSVYTGGAWKPVFVDIAEELNPVAATIRDITDFDPYNTVASAIFLASGRQQRYQQNAGTFDEANAWKTYDYDRLYEIKWQMVTNNGKGLFSTTPSMTENTWYDMDVNRDFELAYSSGLFRSLGEYILDVLIRDKLTSTGQVTRRITLQCDNGLGL